MRNKIFPTLLIFSLLIPYLASAQSEKRILKRWDEIQNEIKNPLNISSNNLTCPMVTFEQEEQDCLKLICPVSDENPTAIKMLSNVENESQKLIAEVTTKIHQKLQTKVQDSIKQQLESIDNLRMALKSGDTKVQKNFQSFHNLMFLIHVVGKAQMKEGSTIDNIQLDYEKTQMNIPALLKENDENWLTKAVNGFYKMPQMIDILTISSDSLDHVYRRKYPGVSFADAIKKEATELKVQTNTLYQKVFKGMGFDQTSFDKYFDTKLADDIISGKRSDEAAYEKFFTTARMTSLMANLWSSPEKYPWFTKRETASLSEIVNISDILKRLDQAEALLKNQAKVAELTSNDELDCIAKYAQNITALPTKDQIKKAKEDAKHVLDNLKEKVFTKFSTHTAEMLNSCFEDVEVILPQDKFSFEEDFYKNLDLSLDGGANVSLISDETKKQFSLIDVYSYFDKDWTAESGTRDALTFCADKFSMNFVDDRAITNTKVFYASWSTVKYPNFGKSIMAHEMGHIMEACLMSGGASSSSFKDYIDIENCLAKKHPEANPKFTQRLTIDTLDQGKIVKQSFAMKQFNQEDLADLVSSTAFPEFNVGCGLLGIAGDEKFSVFNTNAEDVHSSNIFRALHAEYVRKGKLPNACNETLAKAGIKTDFSSCWKK
ncbi:MAG: hypothetical protein ACOYL6_16825 [Bacteriovoracaceae bacterium]